MGIEEARCKKDAFYRSAGVIFPAAWGGGGTWLTVSGIMCTPALHSLAWRRQSQDEEQSQDITLKVCPGGLCVPARGDEEGGVSGPYIPKIS